MLLTAFCISSPVLHLFAHDSIGQDPTIDGNYELRNVADHRLRTCRRDTSVTKMMSDYLILLYIEMCLSSKLVSSLKVGEKN